MRLILTEHAIFKLGLVGVTREEIERAIDQGEHEYIGETALEYDATIRGLPVHIVVVREPEPARLITVYARD